MGYLKLIKLSLNYFGSKMMREKSLKRLLDKQYKMIKKEPSDEKNHIIIGEIKQRE